jgi:large subunit ribosomal protein L27
MSHVKAGGTSKNNRNSPGQRLGVKRFGGQKVSAGEVLVRQVGETKQAGPGTYMSRNFTIHAEKDGVVGFRQVKTRRFTGKTARRTQVVVE